MESVRKRKVDELSVAESSLKRFRAKRSNTDGNSTKNSVKFNKIYREFELVVNKTIVNQCLDDKNSLRGRLERISNNATTTCRSESNKRNTNNVKEIPKMDTPKSHENSDEITNFVIKIEIADDTNNDVCVIDNSVFDSSIIKQELPDETANTESPSVCESDVLTFGQHQLNNFTIKKEDEFSISSMKIEYIDSTLDYNYVPNDDFTVDEEFKSEELETYFENQENQSNSTSKNAAKESTTNQNLYRCSHCNFKTISKPLFKRHVFHNHFDKNGYLPCDKCNQKFKTDKVLNLHKKVCGTKLYYTCKFCPKTLNKSFFIRRHIISQHADHFKLEELDGIMQEIIKAKVRKDENEMNQELKKISITKTRARGIFDRNKYIKLYCSKCNEVSERGRISVATDCRNCGTTLLFQCQMCGKSSNKICTMRSHVKWSCESAEIKLMGNNIVLPNLVRERKIIVHTRVNPLLDEIGQSQESDLSNNECQECIKKNFNCCKHNEYKRFGCGYERGLAICPKCNAKFRRLQRCMEHQILCSVQFRYACPFCHYTSKLSDDVKRHLKCTHTGKFDMEKFQDIYNELKNERNRVKEKYEADCRSSTLFKIIESK